PRSAGVSHVPRLPPAALDRSAPAGGCLARAHANRRVPAACLPAARPELWQPAPNLGRLDCVPGGPWPIAPPVAVERHRGCPARYVGGRPPPPGRGVSVRQSTRASGVRFQPGAPLIPLSTL